MPRLFLAVLLLGLAASRPAAQAPSQPIAELADASALVVEGQVQRLQVRAEAGTIYTYVTVRVDEVLKGSVGGPDLVVKLLGGTLPTLGLYIGDQAAFTVNERVLLFLNSRPRDGSLYTVGLERGKWRLLPDLQTGASTAVQSAVSLPFDDRLRATVAASRAQAQDYVAVPAEVRGADSADFTFIPSSEGGPARWHEVDDSGGGPIPVDYQTIPGGLPGGGSAQLDAALGSWNGVNTRLGLSRAATGPHTCPASTFTNNGHIALYWNDPCGEVADSDPATFGIGGGYFTPGFQKTINGVTFNAFLQGLAILNNTGPHLGTAACLQDAVTHVLGHAVGLGHSNSGTAVMFPTLRASCSSGSTGLGTDDIAGLQAIYPPVASGGTPPHAPTAITNLVQLDTVQISWTPAATGGPAQNYILEAGSGPGLANIATFTLNAPNTSTVVTAVPQGIYYVRVRARNVLGTSAASPDTVVNVGPCVAPGAPTSLSYSTADDLVTILWAPPASGITQGYTLYAGFAPGTSNALVTALGATPRFAGRAPFGDYYVRLAARNSCAEGPQTADMLVSVRPCTAAPLPPTGLTFSRDGNLVTLSWTGPNTGSLPSSYQIQVGSAPGQSDLLVQNTVANETWLQAFAPPGTYYVRIVGRNNCGVSATASNEITVAVP